MDRDRGAEASAVPVPPWRTPPKAVNVRQPLSQERIERREKQVGAESSRYSGEGGSQPGNRMAADLRK